MKYTDYGLYLKKDEATGKRWMWGPINAWCDYMKAMSDKQLHDFLVRGHWSKDYVCGVYSSWLEDADNEQFNTNDKCYNYLKKMRYIDIIKTYHDDLCEAIAEDLEAAW
mgnify:CR=1 FL=1